MVGARNLEGASAFQEEEEGVEAVASACRGEEEEEGAVDTCLEASSFLAEPYQEGASSLLLASCLVVVPYLEEPSYRVVGRVVDVDLPANREEGAATTWLDVHN